MTRRFPPTPMSDLTDVPVRYDLAESTCPPLRLSQLLTPAVLRRLHELETGYGTTPGDEHLRALIAARTGVGPHEVLLTPGGAPAMFLTALAGCATGDHVMTTTPSFPHARSAPAALDLRVTGVPLSFDDGYRLDLDAVAAALTDRTRLVSLASPQNPSGRRFTDVELKELLELMDRAAPGAVLMLDETYRQTAYGDAEVPASGAALDPRVITTSSLSKSHGAPGLRVGWLTCTDPGRYEQLRRAKFTTVVSGSGVDEILAAEVLAQEEQILGARRATLTGTLATLEHWADRHAGAVDFLRPDGGALCCLRLRPDRFDDDAVRRFYAAVAQRDTRVAPGSWFGEHDRVFRVGFGHLPPADFATGLDRLADALGA